jgi:hypothetical protein
MLFKFSNCSEEIAEELEKSVKNRELNEKLAYNKKIVSLLEFLNKSAEELDNLNLTKEANIITRLAEITSDHLNDYVPTHEGPGEYKREALEDRYLDEILDELNEPEDEVEIG